MKKLLTISFFSLLFFFSYQTSYAECGTITSLDYCDVSNRSIGYGNYVSCSGTVAEGEACCETSAECHPTSTPEEPEPPATTVPLNVDGPSNATFDALNPLITDGDPDLAEQLSSPGGIVSRFLRFLFPLAGLALFAMLIWGGFEILSKSAQSQKALDAGKNRITAAIVGFLLLFATYWMAQIIEAVFGIVIV